MLCGIGYYLYSKSSVFSKNQDITADGAHSQSVLTKEYKNDTYGFSLKMPADYTSQEMQDPTGATTIVFQNAAGDGGNALIAHLEPGGVSGPPN